MVNAGISNELFEKKEITLSKSEESLLRQLSEDSFTSYLGLKNHPYFVDYLANVSPLRFYSQTNIGSRPTSRNSSGTIALKDLRAIPFVGSWSQLKQNVTGYYGAVSYTHLDVYKRQHFALLDVRQESSIHSAVLEGLAGKDPAIPAQYNSCRLYTSRCV